MLRQPDLQEAQSSSLPSQHLRGGVTVESKASVVVPPRLDTVDIRTHTPEGCEVLGSRRPCLTNTASRLCLSVSVPADWGQYDVTHNTRASRCLLHGREP